MEHVDIFQNAIIFFKMSVSQKGVTTYFFHLEKQMFVHPKSEGLYPLNTDTYKNSPFVVQPFEVLLNWSSKQDKLQSSVPF